VRVAKKYLSYFQKNNKFQSNWSCVDQTLLRNIIPENRLRIYDIFQVITTLCDVDSVLELRKTFGIGMITSLVRIEGKPYALIANNPKYLSGAIDSEGTDKAARFLQLCDAFQLPILFLCDTPGFMVGPESEKKSCDSAYESLVRNLFIFKIQFWNHCFTQRLWLRRTSDGRWWLS